MLATDLTDEISDALLRPRSIALVGASADPNKHSALPQQFLQRHGYAGRIFPINPGRATVFGLPAFPSVAAVGEPIDHAFIMLPTSAVQDAVADCCAAGVRCATILSNGFAEAGDEGRRRQEKLLATARARALRLLGPNSLGVINLTDHVTLSANEILSSPELKAGRYGLISQSGSLIGALLSRGMARGFGFSKLISTGNEADIAIPELGDMLIADEATDAVLLFLETIRDPDGLARMVARAFAAGKPVVAFHVGRSEIGEKLAASHTGALAGSSRAMAAYLREIGAICVETIDGFLEAAPLFRGKQPARGRRVTVVSTTGGGGALIVDAVSRHGIDVVPPAEATVDALVGQGVTIGLEPLIDLTLAGTNPKTYGAVLNALLDDPQSDLVVAVVGSSSQFRPDRAVAPIVAAAERGHAKPVAAFLTPHAATSLALLAEGGASGFRTPESCADVIRAYFDWRRPRSLAPEPAQAGMAQARAAQALHAAQGNELSTIEAAAVFAALGVPMARERMLPLDVAGWGESHLDGLAFPAVAKIVSPDIAHKTEVGGVIVGIASADTLRAACSEMVATVSRKAPGAALVGIQVQPMLRGLGEVLLGFRRDLAVGPIVTLGAGGVLTEIYRDVEVRLAPIDEAGAGEMIAAVKGLAPIRGYRGLPRGDLAALAKTISNFSRLASLAVAEAEINPVLVLPEGQGVVAVDAVLNRIPPDAQ